MIEAIDVRVDYDDTTAVHGLDLTISEGQVFGLIGPNGAGKTSTIRVLATLQRPTYGDVAIGGIDIETDPGAVHRILGYMPDLPPVDPDLRCEEFLMLYAGAYFVDRRSRRRRVEECLERVSLLAKRRAMAGTLSRGMTQRLVLAKTLLHAPRVLLLDEPASGLDPIARIELREILRSLAQDGCSILISSHILTELADMCDSVGIMERGHMRVSGQIDTIVEQFNERRVIVLECLEPIETIPAALAEVADEPTIEHRRIRFGFQGSDDELAALLRALVLAELPVLSFHEERMNLEDIVMKVGAREVS